jgi:hypothetical protein
MRSLPVRPLDPWPAPEPYPELEPVFYSVAQIAARWGTSDDTVRRVLEKYRGQTGFMELGWPEDIRKHKRKYSIPRIHSTLLLRIEADLN